MTNNVNGPIFSNDKELLNGSVSEEDTIIRDGEMKVIYHSVFEINVYKDPYKSMKL